MKPLFILLMTIVICLPMNTSAQEWHIYDSTRNESFVLQLGDKCIYQTKTYWKTHLGRVDSIESERIYINDSWHSIKDLSILTPMNLVSSTYYHALNILKFTALAGPLLFTLAYSSIYPESIYLIVFLQPYGLFEWYIMKLFELAFTNRMGFRLRFSTVTFQNE